MSKNFNEFIPYFLVCVMIFMCLFHKIIGGMSNSVDPDLLECQTV